MRYKSQLSPLQFLGRKASEIFYYIFSFALIYKFYTLLSMCAFYEYSLVARKSKKIPVQRGRPGFDPWVETIPWRRAWQPTPVFLPGVSLRTEKPGGLQSMGLKRVGHNRSTENSIAHVY